MDSIVRRLKESRDIETAKSIVESAGYKVSKELDEGDNNNDIFSKIANMSNEEIAKDREVEDYIFSIDDDISDIVANIVGDGFDDSSFSLTKDRYSEDLYFKGQGIVYTTDREDLNKIDSAIQDYLENSDFPDAIDTEWSSEGDWTRIFFYCRRYADL